MSMLARVGRWLRTQIIGVPLTDQERFEQRYRKAYILSAGAGSDLKAGDDGLLELHQTRPLSSEGNEDYLDRDSEW